MTSLFVFGTLRHAPLLRIVAGMSPASAPAILADHGVWAVKDQPFPILTPHDGGAAEGLLLQDLTEEALARIDFFEGIFAYHRETVRVTTEDGTVEADVYLPPEGKWETEGAWDLDHWVAQHAKLNCAAAEDVMARRGHTPPADLARFYPFIRAQAWSRLLAERTPAPTTLRHHAEPGDVQVVREETPFNGFFKMKSFAVSGRQFEGDMGAVIERECFISYDAALVVPYDPVTDRVLLIEQMRLGPLWRGDPQPWAFEPIAGLVDAGEEPADCARREAVEEAGLQLDELLPLAQVYPAPGYVTEFYHCFVGLTDLDPSHAGIGGLISESENIRSHVLSFDEAMALTETGEITTAPLMMILLWLARHRERLRREHAS